MPLDVPDSGPGAVESGARRGGGAPAARISIPSARRDSSATRSARSASEAGPDVPVIGFAAAPWTLACYMIEGRTRGDISRAKQMLREEPQVGARTAGANRALRRGVFESADRGGSRRGAAIRYLGRELTTEEYDAFELPATQMILRGAQRGERAEDNFRERLGAAFGEHGANGRGRAERRLEHGSRGSAPKAGPPRGAARKRGPVDFAGRRSRNSPGGARSDRKNRRRGAHTESRPRHFADTRRSRTQEHS